MDLRARTAFAAGHVPGTVSFALDDGIATYLGWLIPWGAPLTLLGHNAQQVSAAQRELARIGVDRPAAAADGRPEDWAGGQPLRSYPVAGFADLEAVRHHRPVVMLDVRLALEWADSHVDGAVHIPLHDLLGRLGELPAGEVWVYCRTGHRASIAASILDAAGRTVVADGRRATSRRPARAFRWSAGASREGRHERMAAPAVPVPATGRTRSRHGTCKAMARSCSTCVRTASGGPGTPQGQAHPTRPAPSPARGPAAATAPW